MVRYKVSRVAMAAALLVVGYGIGRAAGPAAVAAAPQVQAPAAAPGKVYEIRTYVAPPGKLEALHARFRNHALPNFARHNMKSVAYFRPIEAPLAENTLTYILEHPSREAAQRNWAAFHADPAWVTAKAESEKDGRIVQSVQSVFATATDYSPMK